MKKRLINNLFEFSAVKPSDEPIAKAAGLRSTRSRSKVSENEKVETVDVQPSSRPEVVAQPTVEPVEEVKDSTQTSLTIMQPVVRLQRISTEVSKTALKAK